jgi:regulator of protease activity HflC (stomatin/prohibitin superfamily)
MEGTTTMNRIAFVLTILLCAVLGACSSVTPGPGEEAVLIKKPMFFGHGGVVDTPVTTGREFVALTTDAIYVNTQPIKFELNFDDLMTADTVPLDFHGTLRLQVIDSVKLIDLFGPKWYENNIQTDWASFTRDAVKRHQHSELLTTSIEQVDAEVERMLVAHIAKEKLPVQLLGVTAGRANPPPAVAQQRIETATQQQRIQTETQREQAEIARLKAEQARAEADHAYRLEMTISPEQFVQLEALKISSAALVEVCGGGKGNCQFLMGEGAAPVFNVRSQ